ncbi:phenylacetate--CoA ligase family protein [Paucibacter sp. B51]|uniref:phenylacetate--CoA ligase family protein n=1 Tax=Paucibacter sp. B51 TaxID=2993315 RepID=UPI0022EBB0B1|nr:hypothetical protein [Paucibacter sp. B51]
MNFQSFQFFLRHKVRRNALAQSRAHGLLKRERLSAEQLRERQAQLLRATVLAARESLPHYRELPTPPEGTAIFAWLTEHCGVVGKAQLVEQRQAFYPNHGRRRPWWPLGKTSGTSGSPLEVFRSLNSVIWEEAFNLQFWAWAGYQAGDHQAVLRGDQAAPAQRTEPPFWLWDRFGKQLFLSTRHLSAATAPAMAEAVRASGAQLLRAYPSSSYEFARLCELQGLSLPLRAVVTGSEPLYPVQREQLERSFGCKVFDFYGMAERIAYAAQCEHGHYHLNPEYAFVEILDEQGRATADFGHVVGTSFHNSVMPLIRYRISDRARWLPGSCPCGRSYPRIELSSGKVEDQLFDRDGNAVSASVITFAFKGLDNIRKSQVAQVGPGEWEIRVVADAGYTEANSQALLDNIGKYVSDKLHVRVRLVEDIALMPSGKFKWVAQEYLRPGAVPQV